MTTEKEQLESEIVKRDARISELESCISSLLEECDPMQLNAGEPWCHARSLIDDKQLWTCSGCGQATTDEYEHFDHIADCGGAALKASADSRLVPVELLERLIKYYEDGMSIYGECEELRALLAQSESEGVKP